MRLVGPFWEQESYTEGERQEKSRPNDKHTGWVVRERWLSYRGFGTISLRRSTTKPLGIYIQEECVSSISTEVVVDRDSARVVDPLSKNKAAIKLLSRNLIDNSGINRADLL
jgi:hypothetical protein